MFWGGIGLAPLAALLILLGGAGATVRLGAVLGVIAPVMIAVSFALRPDPDSIRLQFEETLLEELDLLRSEVREEIAKSARTSHQMVGERLGALQQTVDTLRAAARAAPAPPPAATPPAIAQTPYQPTAAAAPPPVTSRAAVPRSGAPRAAAAAAAPPASAAPPVAPRSAPPPRHTPPASPAPAGNGRASVPPPSSGRRSGGRSGRHQADGYAPAAGGRSTPSTGGVYRRTDTGQLPRTDTGQMPRPAHWDDDGRPGPNGAGASRNGRASHNGTPPASGGTGYGGSDWSPPAPRGRGDEPYEESWTDQKLRERYGRRPRPYGDETNGTGEPWRQREDGRWEPVISAEPVTRGRRRRWEDDSSVDLRRHTPGDTGTQPRYDTGSMPRYDTGTQPRYDTGSMPRYDTGTQPRYEDRWSSARDEPNGYRNGTPYSGNGYGNARPDYTRRALPAGSSSEPSDNGRDRWGGGESWNDSWEEPARESRGRRYRPDFELTDERWR
ncbi:MAG TPA: hypothetical protein VIL37_06275 [Natronosporangium sp.]